MKKLSVLLVSMVLCYCLNASNFERLTVNTPKQNPLARIAKSNSDTLPKVFMLGEFDGTPFETLKTQYEYTLVSVCQSDMETAYYCWLHMLTHLESYSKRTGFDLNGVKLWLYAFWNKDGTVSHLAYYLKPNSRNVTPEELKPFLTGFANSYTFPVKSEKDFSNYGSAAFPVQVEKKNPATAEK